MKKSRIIAILLLMVILTTSCGQQPNTATKPFCSVEGCQEEAYLDGLCPEHFVEAELAAGKKILDNNANSSPTPTQTPKPTEEAVPTSEVTDTPTPELTEAPTEGVTNTPVPTKVATSTPAPTKVPTSTPVPTKAPTNTPTNTPVPTKEPTSTPTPVFTNTPTPELTPAGIPDDLVYVKSELMGITTYVPSNAIVNITKTGAITINVDDISFPRITIVRKKDETRSFSEIWYYANTGILKDSGHTAEYIAELYKYCIIHDDITERGYEGTAFYDGNGHLENGYETVMYFYLKKIGNDVLWIKTQYIYESGWYYDYGCKGIYQDGRFHGIDEFNSNIQMMEVMDIVSRYTQFID